MLRARSQSKGLSRPSAGEGSHRRRAPLVSRPDPIPDRRTVPRERFLSERRRCVAREERMIVSVLSLFSGIGLFDLGVLAALEEAGIDAHLTAQVEIDPFCRQVLARHYPNVSREVTDVRDVYPGSVPWSDFIIGGFPCTDVSSAGRQAGLSGEHSGLWWEYRRIIDEMRPRAVLIENVASGVSRWHGAVCCSLEAVGYRTRTRQISAADVGAPHRRERVFVLAYPVRERLERTDRKPQRPSYIHRRNEGHNEPALVRSPNGRSARLDAHRWPAGRGQAQYDWEPPRTAYGVANRTARLKALGNAVTPHQGREAMRWALSVLGWNGRQS